MVSGLVTSPCDQLRIFSGEARLIRMESKSAIDVPRSNGLERYKVSSCGFYAAAAAPGYSQFLLSVSTPSGKRCGVETGSRVSRLQRRPVCGRLQEF